jgi:hypothetical protein
MRFYRSVLLVSTMAWFMIGLHVPALHQATHHGSGLSASMLVGVATLAVLGVATLTALLRASAHLERPWRGRAHTSPGKRE